MKKFISIVLSACLICTFFTACSSLSADMTEENITATVDTAMTALKDFDSDALDTYVDSSTLSVIIGYAEKHDQFAKLGRAIFENLTYEITSIDTDAATVTLSVKNKDLSSVASEFAENLKSSYSTIALLGKLSDENFLDESLGTLCDSIDSVEMSDSSVEIMLTVTQEDDHLVLGFDDEAENEVSGGALDAIKSIYS
ncbi:MAG: hypothetical protein LUG95_03595 [Clostridiales bacterium]|nr:hypothetical protein [Clostridiales bacterium]